MSSSKMAEIQYTPIKRCSQDDASGFDSPLPKHNSYRKQTMILAWLQVIAGFLAGVFTAGMAWTASEVARKSDLDFLNTAGSVVRPIEYDNTYPGPPTPQSEQEWLDLLPSISYLCWVFAEFRLTHTAYGLGFVQHENFGDGIVAFTVFHQLHCLMALRHTIYDSWNGSEHAHMTPHHAKHCLEYIRQTIMCSADSNTEARVFFESEPNHNPGWGLHRCRDYERLKGFAEDWRVWDGKTPPEKTPVIDPDVLKGRVIYY